MKEFDKRYVFYGTLEITGKPIGECRCEVMLNEINPESLSATVSSFAGSTSELQKVMNHSDDFQFVAKDDATLITVKGAFPSLRWGDNNDEPLRFEIREYSRLDKRNNEIPHIISLAFYIPHSDLYQRLMGISKHYRKGLLCGWQGWRNEFGVEVGGNEWIDEVYPIQSEYGRIAFMPILVFQETKVDNREVTIAVDQMCVECEIKSQEWSLSEAKQKITEFIDDALYMLSLIEGTPIYWYTLHGHSRAASDVPVEEIAVQRKAIKRGPPKWYPERCRTHRKQLQEFHSKLASIYHRLKKEEKVKVDRLIQKFLTACRTKAIDTKLIYWHSCLDVLIKASDGRGRSFSHRLVDACMNKKIEWKDIYSEVTEESLKSGVEFPINEMRNGMLHHGEHIDDFAKLDLENRKSRALAERFMARIIGVEYEGTGFGQLEKHS